MDKRYNHKGVEKRIYSMWEKKGYFTPKINLQKKPFTIIMPPPNANGSLHLGHAMFLTLEDIMIRYNRMKGNPSLWLPGADHAGILTQVVFERKLEKEKGLTRYDLGRKKFIKQCMEFTLNNKKVMENQMRAIGASCDWTRKSFTLDPKFNKPIYQTFKRLYMDGLLYRSERIINWCPRCSTALSDLEVIHKEQKDPLYYLKYGPFVLATVRPETKFGDTAVAVNPTDKRYKNWVGKEIEFETLIGMVKMKVIEDEAVDPKFGTGVVKVTPAHDMTDFEIGQRHNLEIKQVIGFDGKLNEKTKKYQGLSVEKARKKVVHDLEKENLLEHIDKNYIHAVSICERCKTTVEPMVSLQWFVNTNYELRITNYELKKTLGVNKASLGKLGLLAIKRGLIKIIPKRFEKNYFIWMRNIKDWCISRQLWWGHRLPVYYCGKKSLSPLQLIMNPNLKNVSSKGCGETIASVNPPSRCPKCKNSTLIQDPDTLDTWFSSGQWPYTTLGWSQEMSNVKYQMSNVSDYQYFYPTSVMETGYEILFFWVARMIMLGLYTTGREPFKTVYLHGLIRDALGEKMSKSKGNAIDPLDVIEKFGADSLRMALVFGTSLGSDVTLGEKKIEAMRNFGNKLWNISRFVKLKTQNSKVKGKNFEKARIPPKQLKAEDRQIIKELKQLVRAVTDNFENYHFAKAAEKLYQFTWHRFADKYLESIKLRNDEASLYTLCSILYTLLRLLHPFMPFITEEINSQLSDGRNKPLIVSPWPNT